MGGVSPTRSSTETPGLRDTALFQEVNVQLKNTDIKRYALESNAAQNNVKGDSGSKIRGASCGECDGVLGQDLMA